ncbi:MAG TPA: benzoate/H(+) symporter BenE family transporter [Acidimicrobiia bacterium]
MEPGAESRRFLRPLAAGLSLAAVFVAVVAIPLDAAAELGLSPPETSAWILAVWGLPGVLTIILTVRYRQPLLVTGNIFILIFVLSLGGELSWPELVGATIVAGGFVLLLGITGLTHWLARFLPSPIVYGLLAGAVLDPLLADSITSLGTSTLLVGSTFAAYFLSEAIFGKRVPALLSALVVGVVVAVLGSQAGPMPHLAWPQVAFTLPEFTFEALITATPVLVVFITLQANAPSIVYLRAQQFEPPERATSLISGAGTIVGSVFGPMGVSLSLPATALTAGPDAGDHDVRRLAAYIAAAFSVLVALSSGFASELLDFIPRALLDAIVGLAVLGILARALGEVTKGPLRLGPIVAFAVAVSDLELLGLGRFFWAIVFGVSVSLLLERRQWSDIETGGTE